MSYNPDKKTRFFRGNCSKKDVKKIPGIWKKNGKKLNNEGCETALDVLKIFEKFGRDEFLKWLVKIGITNSEQKRDCCRCMEKWSKSRALQRGTEE